MTRRVIRPVLAELVEQICHQYIWRFAATITDTQLKPLSRLFGQDEDSLLIHFLRDHRRAPPNTEQGTRLYPYK